MRRAAAGVRAPLVAALVLAAVALALALAPVAGLAQGDSLGAIRRDLQMLRAEVAALRAAGAPGAPGEVAAPLPGPILDRIEAIEAELRRLTRATEALDLQIRQTVAGAGPRLDDLAARLAALDGGPVAGAATDPALVPPDRPARRPGPQLAEAEQGAFDRALAALEAGDPEAAARGFAAFVATYPAGPLTQRAHLLRGRALAATGDTAGAARSWLDAFSADPDGAEAPAALFGLAGALADLGKRAEACLTYAELPQRFPASPEATAVGPRMQALDCS